MRPAENRRPTARALALPERAEFWRICALALFLGLALTLAACGEEADDSAETSAIGDATDTGEADAASHTGELNTGDVDALKTPSPLGDMMLGDPDAPVTVIEYASMTCHHCANFHTQNLPKLKEKYIDTGKVKYVFREYPLDPVATVGSMLARCAGEDRYFGFVQVLFEQQANWAFTENPVQALAGIARQGGFSAEKFDACMANQEILDGLREAQTHAAKTLEINATPTIFVNGERINGNLPWADFEPFITKNLPEGGESADQEG